MLSFRRGTFCAKVASKGKNSDFGLLLAFVLLELRHGVGQDCLLLHPKNTTPFEARSEQPKEQTYHVPQMAATHL